MTQETEDRLRETLAAAADRVDAEKRWDRVVADARPPTSERPYENRRWSVAAVAATVLVAVGLGAVFAIRGDGEQATVADGVDFLLPGEVVLNDDPLTVIPAPAPEPEFDTSELGTEVLFEPVNQSDDETTALIEDALRAISPDETLQPTKVTLAGRIDGQPWMIVVADAPNTNGIGGRSAEENLRQRIVVSQTGGSASGEFVPRDSLEMIEAPHVDDASRSPAYSFSAPTGWLDWSDLPAETAVVAFSDADQELWMRPRAGMAAFETQFDNGERFELTAYDASGTVIRTLSETVRYDSESGPTALQVGDRLPVIAGTNQTGETIRIGPDERLTALIFGADWCRPCQDGLPVMRRLVEALDPSVAVYSVPHYTNDPWPADTGWPYPQLTLETDSPLRSVNELPTVVVLDNKNTVLLIETGFDDTTLEALDTLRQQLDPSPTEDPDPEQCAELLERQQTLEASQEERQATIDQAQARLNEARSQSLPDNEIQAAEIAVSQALDMRVLVDIQLLEIDLLIAEASC